MQRREGTTSRFKGVCWHVSSGKWRAKCKEKYLGYHATEEAAARAYNTEAERIGHFNLNVIPPTGDADDGDNPAAPAALALPSPAAPTHTHAGAGSKHSKRAGAPTAPASPPSKKLRAVTSAGVAAGGLGGGAGGGGAGAALIVARIKHILQGG